MPSRIRSATTGFRPGSEIEKLLLYARGQSTVTVEQINDLLLDATAVEDLDALMSATFGGRPGDIVELTAKVSFADLDANRLFATALRYALAFQRARGEIEGGGSRDDGFPNSSALDQRLSPEGSGGRQGNCKIARLGQNDGLHRRPVRRP